jgi:hypothetical protein
VVAVQRIGRLDVALPRPAGLTAGAVRLGLLSLFIVLVAMIRVRITPGSACWVVLAGALGALAGAGLFLLATRCVALQLPLLGVAFFLVWTFVYIAVIEMLTAFALVTAYASSFVDWHRPSAPEDRR